MISYRFSAAFSVLLALSLSGAACGKLKSQLTDGGPGDTAVEPDAAHEAGPDVAETAIDTHPDSVTDVQHDTFPSDPAPPMDTHPDSVTDTMHDSADADASGETDGAGTDAASDGAGGADGEITEAGQDVAPDGSPSADATDAPGEGGSCDPPLKVCSGVCIDPRTDNHHCGTCTNDCGTSSICTGGLCL
jgi:Stigma-specific protein, Stig1